MKRGKREIYPVFGCALAAALMLLSSCDPLLLAPSPLANWNDPDLGVAKLRADVYGDGKMRFAWDWIDLDLTLPKQYCVLEKPDIDKIIIKHSRNSPPTTRIGGIEYDIDDYEPNSNTLWNHVFSDLKFDREHYFALYMHEKNGRWLAPLYASEYMEGSHTHTGTSGVQEFQKITIVPGPPPSAAISAEIDGPPGSSNISATKWDLYYFDVHEHNRTILSASLDITVSANCDVVIYPVRFRPDFGDQVLGAVADRSLELVYPVSTGGVTISGQKISEIIAKAFYHGKGGLLIHTMGASPDITALDISYTAVGN